MKIDKLDALALMGVALLVIGAGLIYIPAGLIVGGIACLTVAVVGARTGGKA